MTMVDLSSHIDLYNLPVKRIFEASPDTNMNVWLILPPADQKWDSPSNTVNYLGAMALKMTH